MIANISALYKVLAAHCVAKPFLRGKKIVQLRHESVQNQGKSSLKHPLANLHAHPSGPSAHPTAPGFITGPTFGGPLPPNPCSTLVVAGG
jgi:hypothetical protein